MTFGDKIRAARKSKGYTQKQLAQIIGIAESTLTGYEKGTREPDVFKIKKIMTALDIDGNYLFESSEPATKTAPTDTAMRGALSLSGVTTWKREYDEPMQKYMNLDDYGRKTVNAVIDVETERIEYELQELDHVDYDNIIFLNLSDQPASAGTGIYLGPEAFSQIKVSKNNLTKKAKFAVTVDGNSMWPDYRDGDILLIGEDMPNMGDFGVFTVDGEGYVKMQGDGILISSNNSYPNIPLAGREVKCNGKVIGLLKKDWVLD